MNLRQLTDALEEIAPLDHAEPWDNVGLLVGDVDQPVSRVMLTIDYTPEVADEARREKCDAVIAYHPPIFDAIKRVTADRSTQLILDAARRGVAIYSPHTALDVAPGGTNDVLADALALVDRRPLKLRELKSRDTKLVVFAPESHADAVADAMFDAGAGVIGDYTRCSFRSPGTGTFLGGESTNPAVGAKGRLERAAEVRIEVVVPTTRLASVVEALRRAHPYEEAAFDLYPLSPQPLTEPLGIGRVGRPAGEASVEMLANLLKRSLGVEHLLVAGDPSRVVKRAAVCAGACGGDLLTEAIRAKVDLYVTGEMRHHDALRAVRSGLTVICTLHSNSERATLPKLAERLRAMLPALPIVVSREDRDPFVVA